MRSLILFFFLSVILNSLVWLLLVPIWHTPDEQAHFAQVAYLALHNGNNPGGGILDTTEEIYISEHLLGTARDKVGNNKFTFHPDYKIEYTNSYYGKYEASISALAKTDAKYKLVSVEASYYPKSYYIPASWLYNLFYSSDLFTRVFIIRFWSLSLFVTNIFFIYKAGKLIFRDSQLKVLTLTALAGFQPMMIFANIGVNSDALGNLLFTLLLYCSLKLIINGLKVKDSALLLVISWLTFNAKIQFVVIIPILFMLFVFLILRDIKSSTKWIILFVLILLSLIPLTNPYHFKQLSPIIVTADSLKQINLPSFLKFTKEYTLPHTIKEVMPWYWGVYKWLGITYPRFVYRIINRLVLIAVIGFVFWMVNVILKKKWHDRQIQCIFFLMLISSIYFISLSVYDWLSWYKTSFQLGIQGRYFFPLISFNMLTIVLGWTTILPNRLHIEQSALKILGLLMIILNIFALYYVSSSYYDTSTLQRFIIQASQYKPWFLKGNYLIALLTAFFISLILLIYKLVRFSPDHE